MISLPFSNDPFFLCVAQMGQQMAVPTKSWHWKPVSKPILAYIFAFTKPIVTKLGRINEMDNFDMG